MIFIMKRGFGEITQFRSLTIFGLEPVEFGYDRSSDSEKQSCGGRFYINRTEPDFFSSVAKNSAAFSKNIFRIFYAAQKNSNNPLKRFSFYIA